MEEIGCHFKFEKINGSHYHNTDLLLSSGRNCFRYIIRERNIETIYLPYFLCESLSEVSQLENINIIYYHIDDNFIPVDDNIDFLDEHTYIYLVNYYGLLGNKISNLIDKYKYVIVDNTHNFFDKSTNNVDTIYNYRKYFGVPDGACIVSNNLNFNPNYSIGKSINKIIEMVLRDETGEFFHYPSFLEADKYFKNEDLVYMSNFTKNYLNAINYNDILKKRLDNFKLLMEKLNKYNEFDISKKELTYMFPLLTSYGEELRNYLKSNNIYAVKLWPNVLLNGANNTEIAKVNNIILLPIDQRYSPNDMNYISSVVDNFFSSTKVKTRKIKL